MHNTYFVAVAVTAACGILSARCAIAFFAAVPRLFTAAALLSLAWLMVLPYYSDLLRDPLTKEVSNSSTLLTACASYLLVVVGSLARRVRDLSRVEIMDRYALLLLVPLASGSKPDLLKNFNLTDGQFETILTSFMGILGYIALWVAARSLKPRPSVLRWFTVTAFLYALLELTFLVITLFNGSAGSVMGAGFGYTFAAAKLALTPLFLYILIASAYPAMGIVKMVNVLVGADESAQAALAASGSSWSA